MASPALAPVLETVLQIVVVSPFEPECFRLRRLLGHAQSVVTRFPTWRAALAFLREHSVGVVICDKELPDGSWRDLLEGLYRFTPPPSLIVSSRRVDAGLWAEVLNLGGYDMLLMPFEAEEVRHVCIGAWRAWECARQSNLAMAAY